MLKHGVMKEPAELCTRLQMTKGDEDSVHRVLDVVSSAMVKMEDGKQTLTALELDLKETAIQGYEKAGGILVGEIGVVLVWGFDTSLADTMRVWSHAHDCSSQRRRLVSWTLSSIPLNLSTSA